jgi:glycerophosphoryl diester phosphodiesterase
VARGLTALVAGLAAALPLVALGFDLQGHRGARGLAPENTLAAFRKALEIGVTTLETDLGVTRDDVVVVSHEPALYPPIVRVDGAWLEAPGPPLRTLAFADLARYDIGRTDPASAYGKNWPEQRAVDGERFPTLDEVLALAKSAGVRANVETKVTPTSGDAVADPDTFARLVVERIVAAGMEQRVTVQSFDWRTLVAVRRLHPTIRTVCLTNEGGSFDTLATRDGVPSPWLAGLRLADHGGSVPALAKAAGCATWSPNHAALTRERLAEAKSRGLAVVPWTVNQPGDMARLVDWGVDGLITDYPDRARKVLADKGVAISN